MAGRKAELQYLEEMYLQEGNQLLILYGRKENEGRKLIQDFYSGKKYFYYYAPEVSPQAQRQRMRQEIADCYQAVISEDSYDTFLKRIKSGDGSKLVVVIDEFQHILKKEEGFLESILKLKGKKLYPGPVMILLYSSSIAWVEQELPQILGTAGKKIDGQMKIQELQFLDLVRSLPNYSVRESVEAYGVIGGVPEYIRGWEDQRDIRYNICTHILSEYGFLHGKAEEIIGAQLRELSVYHTILEVLASGKHKLNDIYQATGFSRAKISVYLKNLMEFDVVEKIYSFETGGWQNAQKGLYQIKDTFINFWFKFVYPHLSDLHRLTPEAFYDRYIEKELEQYLKRYFVNVCMEYLKLQDMVGKLPLKIHKMGTWIGKKGHIDIIVQNNIRENLICLCNWSEPAMTFEMCQQLFESMDQAKLTANYYYLFTAKSFDEQLLQVVAEDDRILLVDMNRM
ncbi:MAG: ATP-binding protein [Lachnospiraceae bacterium]|nr:ATP-binding protein [Lachnospiraceae bacterium]